MKCFFMIERAPRFRAILLCAALCIPAFSSCGEMREEVSDDSGVTAETRNPLSGDPTAIASGERLYITNCSTCHGLEGKGDGASGQTLPRLPQDLTTDDVMRISDGQIFLTLKNGRMRDGLMTMPPIRRLSHQQMWEIIAYIRTLKR